MRDNFFGAACLPLTRLQYFEICSLPGIWGTLNVQRPL